MNCPLCTAPWPVDWNGKEKVFTCPGCKNHFVAGDILLLKSGKGIEFLFTDNQRKQMFCKKPGNN